MLRDEIALFSELSGRDGEHTPIGVIGAYLDGYEKGYEDAIKPLEKAAKKAQEAIEVFKQGLDKAEEQAKQMSGKK